MIRKNIRNGSAGASPQKKEAVVKPVTDNTSRRFAPERRGQPSGHWQDDRVGHEVGGEHPGGFVGAGREVAGDVRQRNIDHGRIQHLHEGARHDGNSDQPGINLFGNCSVLWHQFRVEK
jgi:hypothetical protein